MPLSDQFLGKIGNDAFGPTIKARRTALEQRGNLGDFHDDWGFLVREQTHAVQQSSDSPS